jgi:hypothetical protein
MASTRRQRQEAQLSESERAEMEEFVAMLPWDVVLEVEGELLDKEAIRRRMQMLIALDRAARSEPPTRNPGDERS